MTIVSDNFFFLVVELIQLLRSGSPFALLSFYPVDTHMCWKDTNAGRFSKRSLLKAKNAPETELNMSWVKSMHTVAGLSK